MAGACAIVVLASIARITAGAQALFPPFAVVSITSPSSLSGQFPGRHANSSALSLSSLSNLSTFTPSSDASGCSAFSRPNEQANTVVVTPGDCDLEVKADNAKAAGLSGIIVVSANEHADMPEFNNTESVDPELGIFILGVKTSLGEQIRTWNTEHGESPVVVSVEVYEAPFILTDVPMLLLICFATSLTVAGAFFSTADLRFGSPIAAKHPGQVVELQWWAPCLWVMSGSIALVVLYMTMKYLIYFVIFSFWLSGSITITEILHQVMRYKVTSLQKTAFTLPLFGDVEKAFVIAACIGGTVSTTWLVLRNTPSAWIFQNIIGISFLCIMQRALRLPHIKLAVSLLSIMFFFDIFWTFCSPLFFKSSVMVEVASGGGSGEVAPMLLRIPSGWWDPVASDRMLGYGDVAVPGLLISFLRRHDMQSHRGWFNGYFAPCVIGYAVGLTCAILALFQMQMAQPALLYLVPGTLGTTLVQAQRRGEVKALWDGTPCAGGDAGLNRPICNYCHSGHPLRLAPAPAGSCDGCHRRVHEGEIVSDCRLCNWYLCGDCRPHDQELPAPVGGDLERSLASS